MMGKPVDYLYKGIEICLTDDENIPVEDTVSFATFLEDQVFVNNALIRVSTFENSGDRSSTDRIVLSLRKSYFKFHGEIIFTIDPRFNQEKHPIIKFYLSGENSIDTYRVGEDFNLAEEQPVDNVVIPNSVVMEDVEEVLSFFIKCFGPSTYRKIEGGGKYGFGGFEIRLESGYCLIFYYIMVKM